MSDDRPIVYKENGTIVYRASALGSCVKALVAARMDYTPLEAPAKIQQPLELRYEEGNLHEEAVIRQMEVEGWIIEDRQLTIELVIADGIIIRGHIDGIFYAPLSTPQDRTIGDVKSQSKEAWDDFENNGWDSGFFPKYRWQFSIYMLALGLPGLLVRKNRNDGRVTKEFIPEPFYNLQKVRQRILSIEFMARAGDLPETCDKRDFPCPYYYLHEDLPPEEIDDETFDKLASEYDDARIEEAHAKSRKDEIGKTLKGLYPTGTKRSKDWEVSIFNAKNPPVYDTKQMVLDGLNIDTYKKQTTSKRVRVKRIERPDDAE